MEILKVVLGLFLIHLTTGDRKALYSNSWAVEVSGGYSVANEIAKKHGFINKGQVGSLNNIYHFVHVFSPARVRREISEFHPKHSHLLSEDQVGYVEQQVIKRRSKRDYSSNAKWNKQWYLHRSSGHDMNVEIAWDLNITGRGAVISILDDGIEHTHPDLRFNYDPLASYDFNDNDDDPFPRYDPTNENKHGTRCAGEVAARSDGDCGVGAAYNSKVGGVRMLDGDVTDVVEASSLSLKPQHIDIYSSSWGPNDDGSTVDGPGKLASKAFVDGIEKGRRGLGSLYVWAAGNGGRYGDSCNCDGYAVSPLTISVGSASEHDGRPWYLEKCSSTLTSTYSSGGVNEKQITTTDLHHTCTNRHTGTSASAPLAAGVMALALEANSNLTWRDMQYLMVYASNPRYPHDDQWHTNGAGLKVSHWYGFGILDGAALVNRARNWVSVPPRRNCTFNMTSEAKKRISATEDSPFLMTIQVTDCNLVYLEHVQAVTSLHIQKGMRKDLAIFLTSPSSTKSILLPFRSHDRHRDGFHLWPFMTVHSWGERPQGNWKFSISVKQGAAVKLEALELILFGTLSLPVSVSALPSQCDSQCSGGCAREGPQYCDDCKDYRISRTMECVKTCPSGTYKSKKMCRSCPPLCAECNTMLSCIRCQSHTFLLPNGSCAHHCSENTYPGSLNSCNSCHQSCLSCSGPLDTNCTSCHSQFILRDNACVIRDSTSCPGGYYFDHRAHECRLCHASCSSCSGKESTQCTGCPDGAVSTQDGRCIDSRQMRSCLSGQYFDGPNFECVTCPLSCDSCLNSLTCTSCRPGQYLTQYGTCVNTCPLNTISDENSLCVTVKCHHLCSTCFGPDSVHCNSCHKGFLLVNNSCLRTCPSHFYQSNLTCIACHRDCQSCVGPSKNQCLACSEHYFLSSQECVEVCPPGSYGENGKCLSCISNCFACTSLDSCTRCRSSFYLLSHATAAAECVANCPPGFVLHSQSHSCRPCPPNCAVCNAPSTCNSCNPGYVYYAPSGSCQAMCPDGYYSSPTRRCTACQYPCNTCIGSPLNCSTCSTGMAMDSAASVCRDCCNPDKVVSQCCDCSDDDGLCHWTNTSVIMHPTASSHSTNHSTRLYILIGLLAIAATLVIVLLCSVLACHHYLKCKSRKYRKVPNHDVVELASSSSDNEIYTTRDDDGVVL